MNVKYKIEKGAYLSDRTRRAIDFCRDVLLLDDIPGRLIVKVFKPLEQDTYGDSTFDGVDEYEIRLWSQDLETVMHEMVHIMQCANYELELYGEGHAYWQGTIIQGLSYEESPWEIEASRLESILVKNFLTSLA